MIEVHENGISIERQRQQKQKRIWPHRKEKREFISFSGRELSGMLSVSGVLDSASHCTHGERETSKRDTLHTPCYTQNAD